MLTFGTQLLVALLMQHGNRCYGNGISSRFQKVGDAVGGNVVYPQNSFYQVNPGVAEVIAVTTPGSAISCAITCFSIFTPTVI